MKKNVLLVAAVGLLAWQSHAQNTTNALLDSLYEAKQFGLLQKANTNRQQASYYLYKAVYANLCNWPQQANVYLDSVVLANLPEKYKFRYWTLRNDNYVKLANYAKAYETSQILTQKFKQHYTAQELKDNLHTEKIWEEARPIPTQKVRYTGQCSVSTKRDLAGLLNVKVSTARADADFVFDTGAGISTITESEAKRLGFKIYGSGDIRIQGFTGVQNKAYLATIDVLKIGNISIQNPLFLVFKDEALSFAGGAYKIHGIVGFPIAKDLGTITISKDSLTVAHTQATEPQNLFMDLLNPVLMLRVNGKDEPFNFDTGGDKTSLSRMFYETFRQDALLKDLPLETKASASAGGEQKFQAVIIPQLVLGIGKQNVTLQKVVVDTENYHVSGKALLGNIGQDFIRQYPKVTISFEHSYLKLE
ncbi:Aspartyl protease [Flexibacter flexilis DSM 6793]|uniref:Aspartyl protease n=1 Tax=Flexibacter flexilis DSM 6793 TaxID=927664 RepID=A0A1I1DL31_9BACT|nr:aspartyl protease family protein [Flexibacter flexilis]SFB75136.1 Aspartyl protease [Flexibacter flexilis DSM 6793]